MACWTWPTVRCWTCSSCRRPIRRRGRRVIAGYLILGALYWLGWRAAQRVERQDARAAWLVVVASALIAAGVLLFMYPFGAADLFDNIMHGRILGVYGANPFTDTAAQFRGDPLYAYTAWKRTTSAYGPAWEMMAGGVAWLVHQIIGASNGAKNLGRRQRGRLQAAERRVPGRERRGGGCHPAA